MATVGQLLIDLGANTARLQSDMNKAVQITQDAGARMTSAMNTVKGAFAALGVIAVVQQFQDVLDKSIETAAALGQMATKAGDTVESLSALAPVAKLSRTGMDDVTQALTKLSKGMAGADDETKGAGRALAALGISAKDAGGDLRAPVEVLKDLADKLALYKDGAGKTALVQDALGKSGAQMLPMLKQLAESGQLNATVTTAQAEAAEHYEQSLMKLSTQQSAVYKIIAMQMIPVMDTFAQSLLDAVTNANGMKKTVQDLANDGSIRAWATDAARFVGFLVDAFDGLIRTVKLAGNALGTMLAVKTALEKGDMAGAKVIFNEGRNQNDAILGQSWFSGRLNQRFADQSLGNRGRGGDPRAMQGTLNYDTSKEGKGESERLYVSTMQQLEKQILALHKASELEQIDAKLREGTLSRLPALQQQNIHNRAAELQAMLDLNVQAKAWVENIDLETKRREEGEAVVASFNSANSEVIKNTQLQISLIGKSNEQQIMLNAERSLAIELERELAKVANNPEATEEVYRLAAAHKDALIPLLQQEVALNRQASTGVALAINNYVDNVNNAAKQTSTFMTNSFKSMEDALVNFVQTGKLDFKSLANSIISDLIRIQIQQQIMGPLVGTKDNPGLLSKGLSGMFGAGGSSLLSGLFGSGGGTKDAQGMTSYGGTANGLSAAGDYFQEFATGGSFPVGGSGGQDSQLVAFKASPDETVSITRPGDTVGGSGDVHVHQNTVFNIDSRSDRAAIQQDIAHGMRVSESNIYRQLRRGGAWSRVVGQA